MALVSPKKNLYERLGLKKGASILEVEVAFSRKRKDFQDKKRQEKPNFIITKNCSDVEYKRILESYRALSVAENKRDYDLMLGIIPQNFELPENVEDTFNDYKKTGVSEKNYLKELLHEFPQIEIAKSVNRYLRGICYDTNQQRYVMNNSTSFSRTFGKETDELKNIVDAGFEEDLKKVKLYQLKETMKSYVGKR